MSHPIFWNIVFDECTFAENNNEYVTSSPNYMPLSDSI